MSSLFSTHLVLFTAFKELYTNSIHVFLIPFSGLVLKIQLEPLVPVSPQALAVLTAVLTLSLQSRVESRHHKLQACRRGRNTK